MPLVRIDLRRGKSAAYKKAISDGVYQTLREIFTCLRMIAAWS